MVEKAFANVENYLTFFKVIDDFHKAGEDAFNNALAEIDASYGHLLKEDETLLKQKEFLKPDVPKKKKETKVKQEPTRASRRNLSIVPPSVNETFLTAIEKTENTSTLDSFRRSSRIASKPSKKTLPSISPVSTAEVEDEVLSPVPPASHTEREDDAKNKGSKMSSDLESTVMCEAAAHSTPLTLSPIEHRNYLEEWSTPKEITPPNSDIKPIIKSTSAVKQRIQEFENRAGQGTLLPSKLPMRTPTKKNANEKPHAENAPIAKTRLLRSHKVLQEKNTNIENAQTKDIKAKKPVALKNNLAGSKVKMGVQNYKAVKSKQCQNENDRNDVKKYFNQMKKKDTKPLKVVNSKALQIESNAHQQMLKLESDAKVEQNHSEELEYIIDHVSENESSEDEESAKNPIPRWATKEQREHPLSVQAWIDKPATIYQWFYNKNIKNPKLEELFSDTIKMRPRTSSAVWHTKTCLK